MNSYTIKLSYNCIKEPNLLNWTDIGIGIGSTYFTDDVAIKHAVSEVTEGNSSDNIVSIACALSGDNIRPYITLFETAEEIYATNESNRAKVVCTILEWLYDHK